MTSTLNLAELTKKITNQYVEQEEGALTQYVKSAIHLLEVQGKDITEYTLIRITNPMQFKDDHSVKIEGAWKVVKMSELENLPTFDVTDK